MLRIGKESFSMSVTRMVLLFGFAFALVGCQAPINDRQQLKAEILSEVLAEVRLHLVANGLTGGDIEETKAQFRREIEEGVIKKLQMLSSDAAIVSNQRQPRPVARAEKVLVGTAEGYILRGDKGLADCSVKLVRLVQAETTIKLLKVLKEEIEFEAVTDKAGLYRFADIPIGNYKLKWQLPGQTGWIRRLKYGPDVTVTKGKVGVIKAVETRRRLVPR